MYTIVVSLLRVAVLLGGAAVAVIKPTSKKRNVENMSHSLLATAYRCLTVRLSPRRIQKKSSSSVSTSLQALTAAALALPGLMPLPTHAAEEETSFLYGYYEESNRNLSGVKSRFNPIAVNSLLGNSTIKLTDRVKFAFNYNQDTWGGATPIATAPLSFGGNGFNGLGRTIGGATPFLQNSQVAFDKQLNPLTSTGARNTQLVQTISSASPETRNQGDFKLGYEWDESELDVGGGISEENDYHSRFGNLAGRWDFNQKLTRVNLGQSYTNSTTTALLDHDAAPYIWETSSGFNVFNSATHDYQLAKGQNAQNTYLTGDRQDWRSSLGLTQVLNENALLEAGLGFTRSTGYMANPYKAVELAYIAPGQTGNILTGQTIGLLEERPNERNQWTENLRYVQHINGLDAAVHFDYSFFHDDWGINAHTFQTDWVQPVSHGWAITPKVRYYSQSAAYFYTPYLVTIQSPTLVYNASGQGAQQFDTSKLPAYYSSDQRLSGFGTLSGGVTLSKQFAKGISFEASGEYYTHAGSLKLGGGGEGAYADFNYYMINGLVKVDLSALSTAVKGPRSNNENIAHSLISANNTASSDGAASGSSTNDDHSGHSANTENDGYSGHTANSADGHSDHEHHGGHAPAGVMFAHMLDKPGDVMVGVRYMRDTQGGNTLQGSNSVSDQTIANNGCGGTRCYDKANMMNMNMIMLDLMYAPTDWLTLMLMPQFVDMNMSSKAVGSPPPSGAASFDLQQIINHHILHEHTTGGVGDTGMYAMFKLLETSGQHIHATLGMSAPTGDVGIKFRDTHGLDIGFQHYGMQLGSGTWDFKPSITYTGKLDKYSWGAQFSGTKRLQDSNASGYALGDIFQSTAWGSYSLLNWLSTSIRGVYTVQGTIKGAYNGTYNPVGPIDYTSNYGGRYWDVGFGVNAFVPSGRLQGNTLSFEWLQPVHDDVNGYQLPRTGALSFTWGYGF